jgi:MSHA biogenesis protein MshP
MCPTSPDRARGERGFTLISALFLLVVLALLGLFIVRVSGLRAGDEALDVGGARAFQAAQAGIEWGLVQVLDPGNADPALAVPGNPQPPACFAAATPALGAAFAGLAVSLTCARALTTELNRTVAVYTIAATAGQGAGTAFAIERQLSATVSRCTDPAGTAPRFGCP